MTDAMPPQSEQPQDAAAAAAEAEQQPYVTVGQTLRRLRHQVGLSARELAARLHYSHSQVLNWEHGTSRVPRDVWAQVVAEIEQERRDQEEMKGYVRSLGLADLTDAVDTLLRKTAED